jgi:hypothetical protein
MQTSPAMQVRFRTEGPQQDQGHKKTESRAKKFCVECCQKRSTHLKAPSDRCMTYQVGEIKCNVKDDGATPQGAKAALARWFFSTCFGARLDPLRPVLPRSSYSVELPRKSNAKEPRQRWSTLTIDRS